MVEEHKIKTTYETELSQEKPGEWSSIVMELTSPKDPVWKMFEDHLRCAYCGMETRKPIKSIDASSTIREHSKTCSEHPLRELEEEIKVLKKKLNPPAPPQVKKPVKPAKKVRRKTSVPVLRKDKK